MTVLIVFVFVLAAVMAAMVTWLVVSVIRDPQFVTWLEMVIDKLSK